MGLKKTFLAQMVFFSKNINRIQPVVCLLCLCILVFILFKDLTFRYIVPTMNKNKIPQQKRKWKRQKIKETLNERRRKWYFVSKIVLTYREKELFQRLRKGFENPGQKPNNVQKSAEQFIRTVKRTEIFLKPNTFLTFYWMFLSDNWNK